MSEQYKPNVGQLCDGDARRDAIHIAVAPVVALTVLMKGECVKLNDKGEAMHAHPDEAIGIVDPFYHNIIKPGQTFWMFLKPNTITGLRHVWTHPAFTPKPKEV